MVSGEAAHGERENRVGGAVIPICAKAEFLAQLHPHFGVIFFAYTFQRLFKETYEYP